jgi:hypothetical protein
MVLCIVTLVQRIHGTYVDLLGNALRFLDIVIDNTTQFESRIGTSQCSPDLTHATTPYH